MRDSFFSLNLSANYEAERALHLLLNRAGFDQIPFKQKKAIKYIMLNFIHHKHDHLIISFNSNHYTATRYNCHGFSVGVFKKALNNLKQKGYIRYRRRSRPSGRYYTQYRSVIHMTESFEYLFDDLNYIQDCYTEEQIAEAITVNKCPIVLHKKQVIEYYINSRKKTKVYKHKKEYRDTEFTIREGQFVDRYNRFLARHTLECNLDSETDHQLYVHPDINYNKVISQCRDINKRTDVYRAFNIYDEESNRNILFPDEERLLGGRFYGGKWQQLLSGDVVTNKPNLRRFINIDDEPTVEIDFTSMHLNMIYMNNACVDSLVQNYEDVPHPHRSGEFLPKALVKPILTNGINSSTYRKLSGGIRSNCREYKALLDESGLTMQEVLAAFIERHPLLENYLPRPANRAIEDMVGLKLQYDDSKIMKDIMRKAMQHNILILPIHDSVICKKSQEELVKIIMTKSFMEFYGIEDFDEELPNRLLKSVDGFGVENQTLIRRSHNQNEANNATQSIL